MLSVPFRCCCCCCFLRLLFCHKKLHIWFDHLLCHCRKYRVKNMHIDVFIMYGYVFTCELKHEWTLSHRNRYGRNRKMENFTFSDEICRKQPWTRREKNNDELRGNIIINSANHYRDYGCDENRSKCRILMFCFDAPMKVDTNQKYA